MTRIVVVLDNGDERIYDKVTTWHDNSTTRFFEIKVGDKDWDLINRDKILMIKIIENDLMRGK